MIPGLTRRKRNNASAHLHARSRSASNSQTSASVPAGKLNTSCPWCCLPSGTDPATLSPNRRTSRRRLPWPSPSTFPALRPAQYHQHCIAQRQRVLPVVDVVAVAEGTYASGCDCYIQAILIENLVDLACWLDARSLVSVSMKIPKQSATDKITKTCICFALYFLISMIYKIQHHHPLCSLLMVSS